uniref:1-deoxy-D-xylulose 5-phosphate reductoisomerase n=1 Tax=candidate division WOR-3 bacterium TaxID=2052148 RepID=A0A7V3UZK1_UNCW3
MTRVAVFGSTGSVGRLTLKVIAHLKSLLKLDLIVARKSVGAICAQALRYQPGQVGLIDPLAATAAKRKLKGKYLVLGGNQALTEYARTGDYDILVMAMAGTAGLEVVLTALRRGKKVALATKELLVAYGEFIMKICRRHHGTILPLDSELAAIHQCLNDRPVADVERVILTASGGPFWQHGPPVDARLDQVLRHPTWKMGRKITVDSATLMNKGLEVIETCRLFNLRPDQVTAVLHPESIVHSLVEFRDGSILAQLSEPDMRLPIQYCLTYPQRVKSSVSPLKFDRERQLRFLPIDRRRFVCLELAFQALKAGSAATCVLNAADEIAVQLFLEGKIAFGAIPDIIKKALNRFTPQKPSPYRLAELRRLELQVSHYVRNLIGDSGR